MRFSSKKLSLALALCLLPIVCGTANAQNVRIGIVDLEKIFEGYYKTMQASAQLKDKGTKAEGVIRGMAEDYQKANEDYKKLIEAANDQAISTSEREKRKKSAEAKLLEIKEIEQSITRFKQTTQAELDSQNLRMRERIIDEIRTEIAKKAREKGYTLVLDKSAQTVNRTPAVLYTEGDNEFTQEVLATLNSGAPAGVLNTGTPR